MLNPHSEYPSESLPILLNALSQGCLLKATQEGNSRSFEQSWCSKFIFAAGQIPSKRDGRTRSLVRWGRDNSIWVRQSMLCFTTLRHQRGVTKLMKKSSGYNGEKVIEIPARAWVNQDSYSVDLLVASTIRDWCRTSIQLIGLVEPRSPFQSTSILKRTEKRRRHQRNSGPF